MKRILLTFSISFLIFPCTGAAQGEQRYASGTATDQENNSFEYINYGTQDWTIENAKVETYRDGTEIPQVTDASVWANLTTGAWCYYDNDPTKGKLYNWYAIAGIHDSASLSDASQRKELAPEGWHVPTDAEWTTLEEYLIAYAYNYDGTNTNNKIAKAMASNSGWYNSIQAGAVGNDQSLNNSSGFNAFPEGDRNNYGNINGEGFSAVFWTATEIGGDFAWLRNLLFNTSYLKRDFIDNYYGFSVRFVRDASADGAFDIILNGTVSAESNQIKNVADPTDNQDAATKGFIEGLLGDYQSQIDDLQDQIDALQASSGSGTVNDQDGNSYPYLTYGDQVWTVKNAEVVTYRDGTPIPQVTDATDWSNLTTGAWCYYDNDPTKHRLYNWYAVMGIHDTDPNTPNKEFAPEGWHVPTDAEWTTLEEHLIANGYNYDDTTTGSKIAKAMASTTGWNSSTEPGAPGNDQSSNNSSGFNAFPEGFRNINVNGSFYEEGKFAIFWSSSESESNTNYAKYRDLKYYIYDVNRSQYFKQDGFSVRFVRD